jgi:putative phosphoesterase
MRVGLISDTHGKLRPAIFDHFRDVDHILHAGDIGAPDLLAALEAIAPITAVWGNTDGFDIRQHVPERAERELGSRRILVIHGHQFGSPTPAALAAALPGFDILLFGHTHRPALEQIGSTLIVNPGAAGPPRFNLRPSIAILELQADRANVQFIDL